MEGRNQGWQAARPGGSRQLGYAHATTKAHGDNAWAKRVVREGDTAGLTEFVWSVSTDPGHDPTAWPPRVDVTALAVSYASVPDKGASRVVGYNGKSVPLFRRT